MSLGRVRFRCGLPLVRRMSGEAWSRPRPREGRRAMAKLIYSSATLREARGPGLIAEHDQLVGIATRRPPSRASILT
jgi:hypothetical protein